MRLLKCWAIVSGATCALLFSMCLSRDGAYGQTAPPTWATKLGVPVMKQDSGKGCARYAALMAIRYFLPQLQIDPAAAKKAIGDEAHIANTVVPGIATLTNNKLKASFGNTSREQWLNLVKDSIQAKTVLIVLIPNPELLPLWKYKFGKAHYVVINGLTATESVIYNEPYDGVSREAPKDKFQEAWAASGGGAGPWQYVAVQKASAKTTSQPASNAVQPKDFPKELSLDLGNKVSMKLVLIPAGKFIMGQEQIKDPFLRGWFQHQVAISKPFYLGTYEVTQGQWKAIMGTSPWKDLHRKDIDSYKARGFKPPYPLPEEDPPEGPNYAANYIGWEAATVFCWKLSQKTGKLVRLPTEAEWEYACRAGSATQFCFGDDPKFAGITDYAWYGQDHTGSPVTSNRLGTYAHAVGQKRANAWGLYDMHGNVGEWCSDWADDGSDCYYKTSPPVDPQGPASGVTRVVRGGNFLSGPANCRSSSRRAGWPTMPLPHPEYGFRVAISLDADQATAASAVVWAQRQLEGNIIGNVRANRELWAWGGLCAKFVANAYGAPGAGARNANDLYAKLNKRVRAGSIPDPKDPSMRGALVFWSWKADGHVGIYVGEGKVIHTGRTSPPWIGEDELTDKHDGVIEQIGGTQMAKYLGYVPALSNWPETPNPPAVTLIPAPVLLWFGGVVLGASDELTINIRNTGKVAVEVTPIVAESKGLKVGANNAPSQGLVRKYGAFEIISPKAESFILSGGETIGIVVRFSPTAVGLDEAEIHFCRLGSDGNSKVGIASGKLQGTGITGSKAQGPAPSKPTSAEPPRGHTTTRPIVPRKRA